MHRTRMLLFARAGVGGGATDHFYRSRLKLVKPNAIQWPHRDWLIEHLLRLSGQADYWVVLEVTMLIFQSSP